MFMWLVFGEHVKINKAEFAPVWFPRDRFQACSTFATRIPVTLTHCLLPWLARSKQPRKAQVARPHTLRSHLLAAKYVHSKQRLSKSRSILGIWCVAKPQPSLSLPWNGLPPQPCNSQDQWQVDYAWFGTRLTYINFVSYARMADSCTSATTALVLCVHGVYVQIIHKGAHLCPVSETKIERESYIVQTLCPVSETEEKRHWGRKFEVYKQSKQGKTLKHKSHKKPQITWSTIKGNSWSNHQKSIQ